LSLHFGLWSCICPLWFPNEPSLRWWISKKKLNLLRFYGKVFQLDGSFPSLFLKSKIRHQQCLFFTFLASSLKLSWNLKNLRELPILFSLVGWVHTNVLPNFCHDCVDKLRWKAIRKVKSGPYNHVVAILVHPNCVGIFFSILY